jgi:hypothetical protein
MKTFTIWYMRPHWFAEGIFGAAPDIAALERTHVRLKTLAMPATATLDDVHSAMQGENWSPNGEARELIASLDLTHTSMSTGDVIVDEAGVAHMVESLGFKNLGAIAG